MIHWLLWPCGFVLVLSLAHLESLHINFIQYCLNIFFKDIKLFFKAFYWLVICSDFFKSKMYSFECMLNFGRFYMIVYNSLFLRNPLSVKINFVWKLTDNYKHPFFNWNILLLVCLQRFTNDIFILHVLYIYSPQLFYFLLD